MPAAQARPLAVSEEEAPVTPEPRFDVRDGVGVVGLAVLVLGVWQVYAPAAWIVLGIALLVVAWRS